MSEKEAGKSASQKSSLHLKKERINSGKLNLTESDSAEKKPGRKVSTISSKLEMGSAKGRKVSGFGKSSKYCDVLISLCSQHWCCCYKYSRFYSKLHLEIKDTLGR